MLNIFGELIIGTKSGAKMKKLKIYRLIYDLITTLIVIAVASLLIASNVVNLIAVNRIFEILGIILGLMITEVILGVKLRLLQEN